MTLLIILCTAHNKQPNSRYDAEPRFCEQGGFSVFYIKYAEETPDGRVGDDDSHHGFHLNITKQNDVTMGWGNTQDPAEVWPIKGGLPGTTGGGGGGGSGRLPSQQRPPPVIFFLSKLISTAFIDVIMCFSFLTLEIFNIHLIIFYLFLIHTFFSSPHCTVYADLIVQIPLMWDK